MRTMVTIFLITTVVVCVILAGLYSGFCVSQGGFPAREVSYNRAIADVIARYPPSIEMGRRDLGGGRSVMQLGIPERAIRYAGIEEFRRLNPDCCAIVAHGSEGYEPSFISRLFGYESRIVRVRYLVRYLNADDELIAKPTETYVVLSRCGKVFSQ